MSLPNDIAGCHRLIEEQARQIEVLLLKVLELESRVNANRQNSHKPPSSDGLRKLKKALPKKKGGKRGGQKGHKGDTLKMVATPDDILDLYPSHCSCGTALANAPKRLLEKRQVFDLPTPRLIVQEYRQYLVCCPNCKRNPVGHFPFTAKHAICQAHILRELKAVQEQGQTWAGWMHRFLLTFYKMTDQGKASLVEQGFKKAERLYRKICTYADQQDPPPKRQHKKGRLKATKGRNLLNRLQQHQSAMLAFAKYPEVPFTNNQAERDLRPAKIKLKMATSFRTRTGAEIYARIQAVISTLTKHQCHIFKELVAVHKQLPISILS